MIRISGRGVRFHKKVFPVLWFGGLAILLLIAVISVFLGDRSGPWPMFLIMPIVMAAAGYVMMKKAIWPLMDEVWDGGDYLVVIKRGDEERIPLADIINISVPPFGSGQVTLRLRQGGRFGNEISFMPESSFGFNPFTKNPVVEELITRVDRARSAAQRP